MRRNIIFFINPISGTKNKKKLEESIIERCTFEGVAFEILFTSVEGDYNFLRSKIEKDTITDIVICGGDGSLRPIISALLGMKISIGIIPSGSGNGLARSAGIPQKLKGALDVIFNGTAQSVDCILVNNQVSCHLSGLGFDAQVAHDFALEKKRGLKTYIHQVAKNFLTIKNYSFKIEMEENSFTENAICICISNSNQFGNNFKIAPKASISDGLMDVVIFRKTAKIKTIISLIRQIFSGKINRLSEKNIKKKKILYFQTKELKIYNQQNAPFHIDGDPAQTEKEFSIKILPEAFKLLQM
jgi:YegS/Rv2252/BmrU family lipid kinase